MRAFAVLLLSLPLTAQQTKHLYPPIHACGITAHALFDGTPLGQLKPRIKKTLLNGLRSRIQQEAKTNDVIDPAAISTNHLNQTVFVTTLNPTQPNPIYAVMWEERQICGGHENCAWWVVKQDGHHLTVLSHTAQEPLSGWASGLKQMGGKNILLGISSVKSGRQAVCMELKDNQLIDNACAPNCDATEEANQSH